MTTHETYRETKYCNALRLALKKAGHATNNDLLTLLRHEFPNLSATTVHRATSRLAKRREIGIAPLDAHGAIRYDAEADHHDHFKCSKCDKLCDAQIGERIAPIIKDAFKDCSIVDNVVLTGICTECLHKDKS